MIQGGTPVQTVNTFLILLQSAYFLLPAYFANMAPVIFKKLKLLESLNKPVDKEKLFVDKKPLFGKNKTYRGFVSGVIMGILGAYLQMLLFNWTAFKKISIPGIDYTNHVTIILLGILMGLGAITGDLIESFLKRRLNVLSGQSFAPWDQIDLVIGAYIFVLPLHYLHIITISWMLLLWSMIVSFFLIVIVNHISFYLHFRKEKW